ncbi:MAG TPA: iron ABC transporter permease [Thermoanaerobaculia bacterium]|nr:iron ABC transporter permease [Thermoanaerobaculia bacterium]
MTSASFGRLWARLALARDGLRERPDVWAVLLSGGLLAAIGVALSRGAVPVPLAQLWTALSSPTHPCHRIVWDLRLPRILVAGLAGAALAVAGALLQTVVRNPLADSGLLGVNAGAGVVMLAGLLLAPEANTALPFLAFLGGLAAVALTLAVARGGGRDAGPLRLLLSGVAVQAILFSLVALLTFLFADRTPAFIAFTVGSLNGCGWREVRRVLAPVLGGLALCGGAVRPLDLLLLDDDSATGVGLAVGRSRATASCLAALLAAAAVSAVGLVGFVGLLVPNLIRLGIRPTHRTLLPLAALGGAGLLIVADLAARTLAAPVELPVGAFLAFLGGPYFLLLLWRRLP